MSHTPPVPAGNQSPFPRHEPPHANGHPASGASHAASADEHVGGPQQTIAAARDAVTPLADKVAGFARQRPFATAALVGTIGLAILNTLRGRRAS